MKIEDQVCSLTQAQELHELGVRCESYFWWMLSSNAKDWYITSEDKDFAEYPAYNCAELGVMLGEWQVTATYADNEADESQWNLYWPEGIPCVIVAGDFLDTTEAQARASALIWLIKEGHIKADEVKL